MTNGTVECSECNSMFKNKNSLGHHRRNFHMKNDSDSDTSTDVLSVDGSNSKPQKLGNVTFECPQCTRSFKTKKTLSNHQHFFHKKTKVASQAHHSDSSDMNQSSADEIEDRTTRKRGSDAFTESNSEHSNMSTDSESDLESLKGQESADSGESRSDDSDKEAVFKEKRSSGLKAPNFTGRYPVKRLHQSRAVRKIMSKQNITPESLNRLQKSECKIISDINCDGITDYLKVFDLMRENKIDEIIESDKYIRVLHILFNGLKEGCIPMCGLYLLKLDVHTKDVGKSMLELIAKFKNDLSKKKMIDLISKNRALICETFDMFTESMMYYIQLNRNYLDGLLTRLEQDSSFRHWRYTPRQ